MSEIRQLIGETIKVSRRNRMINTILWVVVFGLVLVALYTTFLSIESKQEAITERDAKNELLIVSDSLRVKAEALVFDLEVSEENLQGEKAKLEEIKIAYDSLRLVQLEQMTQITELDQGDELWDYAVKENTIESYTDYIKIKGSNQEVYTKLESLLTNTGYVQIQESNGTMLIELKDDSSGLWASKSARSIRNGVMGLKTYSNTERNGDVILEGQPFKIVQDSIMSGRTRWAKILY